MAKKKRKKTGLAPGSLVFTGEQRLENVIANCLIYNETSCTEFPFDIDRLPDISAESIHWIDIRGVHNPLFIEKIGLKYNIHSLVLEDVLDINQRPKFEEYEDGCYLLLRALEMHDRSIRSEQVSIFFKHNLVITFQEDKTDIFEGVRNRIVSGSGKIRKRGSEYLTYALADNVVDHYFLILDGIEEVIDALENEIAESPKNQTKSSIHDLKREVLSVRKSISPLREAISRFSKSDHELVSDQTSLFIRDLYDHTIQVMDMVETYRDTISGLQDLYLSEISFRMNSVMQVLTIIASIFIPLTFLAGIYGMNFEYIPELKWKYGYFILLFIMAIIFVSLLWLFRKKKWL